MVARFKGNVLLDLSDDDCDVEGYDKDYSSPDHATGTEAWIEYSEVEYLA